MRILSENSWNEKSFSDTSFLNTIILPTIESINAESVDDAPHRFVLLTTLIETLPITLWDQRILDVLKTAIESTDDIDYKYQLIERLISQRFFQTSINNDKSLVNWILQFTEPNETLVDDISNTKETDEEGQVEIPKVHVKHVENYYYKISLLNHVLDNLDTLPIHKRNELVQHLINLILTQGSPAR